mmetsp:Transcript_40266/g.45821  ORF Transcript_40266/g.45821 Transcript_40266/m.45821 type:complete len:206 (+) Transcript_40266:119-736(+)
MMSLKNTSLVMRRLSVKDRNRVVINPPTRRHIFNNFKNPVKPVIDWAKEREFFSNGNFEFCLFGGFVLMCLYDQFEQYREKNVRETMILEIEELTRRGGVDDMDEMEEWLNRKPHLFDCTVRRLPLNLDGYKCIKGVEVGDVLEVLEEKVGPDEMYNLCRTKIMTSTDYNKNNDDDEDGTTNTFTKQRYISAGWFPTMYLEKVKQ